MVDPQPYPQLLVALNLDDIYRNTNPSLENLQSFHGPDNHMYVFKNEMSAHRNGQVLW